MITLQERHIKLFEAKVKKSQHQCWEWTAGLDAYKYGKFMAEKKTLKAHRVAYELYKGPIPNGMMVRHLCFNRKCVNPRHLDIGTAADNARDTVLAGRQVHSRGSKDGQAKLKECDIPFIRTCALSCAAVAKMFGISAAQVNRIRKRQRWGHIP